MIKNFDVSSNESKLAYIVGDFYGNYELRVYDYNSNEEKLILKSKSYPSALRISDDGQRIIFSQKGEIFVYDLELNQKYEIINDKDLIAGFSEFQHKNDNVVAFSAYGKNKPPQIHTLNVVGNIFKVVENKSSGNRFPHWSCSNRYIAYTHQKINDIEKKKWIQIYDNQEDSITDISKNYNSQCIINLNCWSKEKDELVYVEIGENKNDVWIYSVNSNNKKLLYSNDNVVEASYINSQTILFISDTALHIFSLEDNKIKYTIKLPENERILFGPDGSKVRIINNNVYFLTEKGCIYYWYAYNGLKIIFNSADEYKPYHRKIKGSITSFDGRKVSIYHYKPKNPNGIKCILAIGGPGEKASANNRVLFTLLNKGYEVIVPCYRGCTENPYEGLEMGYGDVLDIIEVGRLYYELFGYKLPLIGYSYGGLLTFLALANSENVFSCGISLWGVTSVDKLQLKLKNVFSDEMSKEIKEKILNERSAVETSVNIKTPMIIFHGGRDTTSTTEEVQKIKDSLLKNNVGCELYIYPNEVHGLHNKTEVYLEKLYNFIKNYN